MPETGGYLVIAIIGFFGQTLAVIGAAYLNQRAARKAQEAATTAADNASKAQIATARASRDAADAARALVDAAKANDRQLSQLHAAVSAVKETGESTHVIVNSQKTAMEEKIEAMKATIDILARKLGIAAPC